MFQTPADSADARYDVLIVEDEPVSRRGLLALVTSHGFDGRAYSTAEEALSGVGRDGMPSILLVDLHLPGMNGMEFIRLMEQTCATAIPVLITAAGLDVLDGIGRAHSVQCFRKPLEFDQLITLIRQRVASN